MEWFVIRMIWWILPALPWHLARLAMIEKLSFPEFMLRTTIPGPDIALRISSHRVYFNLKKWIFWGQPNSTFLWRNGGLYVTLTIATFSGPAQGPGRRKRGNSEKKLDRCACIASLTFSVRKGTKNSLTFVGRVYSKVPVPLNNFKLFQNYTNISFSTRGHVSIKYS